MKAVNLKCNRDLNDSHFAYTAKQPGWDQAQPRREEAQTLL